MSELLENGHPNLTPYRGSPRKPISQYEVMVALRPEGMGPGDLLWGSVPFVDPHECSCRTPWQSDGSTLCIMCNESWGWDYFIWYPPKVQITRPMVSLIRRRREALNIKWVDLALAVSIPMGTLTSLGYAGFDKHLYALQIRRLAYALGIPTKELLEARRYVE